MPAGVALSVLVRVGRGVQRRTQLLLDLRKRRHQSSRDGSGMGVGSGRGVSGSSGGGGLDTAKRPGHASGAVYCVQHRFRHLGHQGCSDNALRGTPGRSIATHSHWRAVQPGLGGRDRHVAAASRPHPVLGGTGGATGRLGKYPNDFLQVFYYQRRSEAFRNSHYIPVSARHFGRHGNIFPKI